MDFYKDGKSILELFREILEVFPKNSCGADEKHVPVYEVNDGKICVKVGSAEHPMAENHYIEWVAVQTDKGFYAKRFSLDEKPEACFTADGEKIEAVYAYCNLHGLWKA
ncbi:MAG: desulfoferrodoxin [Ruminococcus flavefaciens]|nr:desulfoferrodoxin [Ruminococcus flavefaciens]